MTKRITQKIKTGKDTAGPGEFQLRTASGESLSMRRGSTVTYKVDLSEEECAQLEGEGFILDPGMRAYRSKPKPKAKKKGGGVLKDLAEPRKQEDDE
jgi:hypothetical protein